MEDIMKIVRGRRSVRAFEGREVGMNDRNKLSLFMEKIENPYGIPLEFKLLDGKKQDLSCSVVRKGNRVVSAPTVFQIDRESKIVTRFEPTETMDRIKATVEEIL